MSNISIFIINIFIIYTGMLLDYDYCERKIETSTMYLSQKKPDFLYGTLRCIPSGDSSQWRG